MNPKLTTVNISYKKLQPVVLLLLVFLSQNIFAQNPPCGSFALQFVENYGGTNSEVAYGTTVTADGGIITIGHSLSRNGDISDHFNNTDYWVVKTDQNGVIEWERSYGGNGADSGKSIIEDSDGNFLLCGYSISNDGDLNGTNGSTDFWIVKVDPSGNIIWENVYGGMMGDNAYSIIESTQGGYVVLGTTSSSDQDVLNNQGMNDMWILKLSSAGTIEWSKTYGGSELETASQIIESPTGGYIAIGSTQSSDGDLNTNNGDYDVMTLKIDFSGQLQWIKTFGGSQYDDGKDIKNTSDGGYILSGVSESSNDVFVNSYGSSDAWLAKFDANGNLIWIENYGGSNNDGSFAVVESPFGGYYLSCYSNSSDSDFSTNIGLFDYWLLKVDQFGAIESKEQLGGSDSEQIKFMTLQGNELLLCGFTDSSDGGTGASQGQSDYYLLRYATSDYPTSDLIQSDTICEGDPVSFDAQAIDCPTCTYLWDDGDTNSNRTVSPNISKRYTVGVSNSSGCSIEKSIDILVSNLDVTSELVHLNKCGGLGSITLEPSGQIGIPHFIWEDGTTSTSRSNLATGNYSVTISDDVCSFIETFTLVETGEAPTVNLGLSQENCGESTIELDASTTGATYLWSTGNTNASIIVNQTGNYSITVTSTEGCIAIDSIDVEIKGSPDLYLGEDFSSCIEFDLYTNLEGMTYIWSTGATTPNIPISSNGNYSVTVTNDLGCTAEDHVNIVINSDLNIELGEDMISCEDVNINAGLSGAIYAWSSGHSSQVISVSNSGDYALTVTDASGCSDSDTVSITILPSISLELGDNKVLCGGRALNSNVAADAYLWSTNESTPSIFVENSGDYSLTVTNSSGCSSTDHVMYHIRPIPNAILKDTVFTCEETTLDAGSDNVGFLWSDNSTNSTLEASVSGLYTVTITASEGCTLVDSTIVQINSELEILESVNHISCHDVNDGIISVLALGGVKPITYSWGVYGQSGSIQNLGAGVYTLNVTDSEGCTTLKSYKIHNPNEVIFDAETEGFACEGAEGQLLSNVHGGTAPYTINWNTGATTENLDINESGTYMITVSDGNNCIFSDTIDVVPNDPIRIDTAYIISNDCEGKENGSIEVIIAGGQLPHQLLWSNSETTSIITDLESNIYTLTISDPNGCSDDFTFEVESNPTLNLNLQGIDGCGENSSWAFTQPTGGLPPFEYIWDTGDMSSQISNLESGDYQVTVTDANGCEKSGNISIENFPALTIESNHESVSCFGASDGFIEFTVISGTAPFTYNWSNDIVAEEMTTDLDTGTYTIFIKDKNGCSLFETVEIDQPEILGANIIKTAPSTENNGALEINPTGGTPPFNVTWGDGSTDMIKTGLSVGNYAYTLTDANGCEYTETVELTLTSASNQIEDTQFIVYPNPNTGKFIIQVDGKTLDGTIEIRNTIGAIVWSGIANENKTSLLVDIQLPSGLYLLNYQSDQGGIFSKKIIIGE